MKINEIDINKIGELLESVPSGMECTGVDLTNGYALILRAGTEQVKQVNYENALNELKDMLHKFKRKELDGKGNSCIENSTL